MLILEEPLGIVKPTIPVVRAAPATRVLKRPVVAPPIYPPISFPSPKSTVTPPADNSGLVRFIVEIEAREALIVVVEMVVVFTVEMKMVV